MIIVAAIVAIMLPVSGCTEDPGNGDGERLTINLASPEVSPRNTGTEMVHDATLDVFKLTPKDVEAKWSDLSVVIKAHDGSVLLPATSPGEHTGAYGSGVEVWYSDTTGGRDTMDEGDAIVISGMDAGSYEGSYVEVIHKDLRAGSSVLPTDFP